MATKKYLWKEMDPPDIVAQRLQQQIRDNDPDLLKTADEAAKKILELQNQIALLINFLMRTRTAQETVSFLLAAGIDRNELRYSWGVPPELIVKAEASRHRA